MRFFYSQTRNSTEKAGLGTLNAVRFNRQVNFYDSRDERVKNDIELKNETDARGKTIDEIHSNKDFIPDLSFLLFIYY